jgi:hypothetical protein
VQVGRHHRHALDTVGVFEHRPVRRVLLVRAEHGRLQRRVAGLDQVALLRGIGRKPVGQRHDERVAPRTEAERERAHVQQHAVADVGLADERRVRKGAEGFVVHEDVQLDRAAPPAAHPGHRTRAPPHHGGHAISP